jgi:hypothetical protein
LKFGSEIYLEIGLWKFGRTGFPPFVFKTPEAKAGWIATKLMLENVVRTAALTAGNPDLSWGLHWKEAQKRLTKIEGAISSCLSPMCRKLAPECYQKPKRS